MAKKKIELQKFKKVLIIRLSSLGDVILTSPVIRALKNINPEIKIDFLVKPNFVDAIKYNSNLNKIFQYSTKKDNSEKLIQILRENNYDLILDLQNNKRSKRITSKLKRKKIVYKKHSLKRFLFVHFNFKKLNPLKSVPEKYVEAIAELKLDEKGAELFLPGNIKSAVKDDCKYVGFAPGSMHITKMWPIDYYIELGNRLAEQGYRVLLFGGKDDIIVCKYLSIYIKNSINLATNNQLLKMAPTMKQCDFMVCNDAGLMHAATALNVPVVVIFGSTVKEFGFAPYKAKHLIIENNELKCRPCSHIGKDSCPKRHFKCMKSLTPEIVIREINKFLRDEINVETTI